MRGASVERTLQLLRILQRRRRTLDQIAGELGVTTRTVRRDLEILSVAGFAVENERSDYADTHVWFVGRDGRCPVCSRV